MSNAVNSWKQFGAVYLWRYPSDRKRHAGWHFTAEDAGCDSLLALLDAMISGSVAARRSVKLARPTDPIWGVPNFRTPRRESLGPMTLYFVPDFEDLDLAYRDERLTLRVGSARVQDLRSAIQDVRLGGGDYSLLPKAKDVPPIWFWWMPWSGSRRS